MNIFITGDSHAAALKHGMDMLINQNAWPSNHQVYIKPFGPGGGLKKPFFTDSGCCAEITNARYAKRIKRLPLAIDEGCYEYYGISGSLFGVTLWRLPQHWSNHAPLISQGGKAPLSISLLRHVILQNERYVIELIKLLTREGVKVFVIEGPKPFRHHPAINKLGADLIINLDSLYRSVIKERLTALEIPVIAVPSDCYDDEGFMLETFRHKVPSDLCHANEQFGALMVKEIITFVDSL